MKAIVYERYGSPDALELREVEKPVPREHEVLVRVHAASVNSWDWDLLTGKPQIYRLMFGLFKPKHKIIGSDVAGKVEATGRGVKLFQPGDEVFGDISGIGFGAFADYVCVPETLLALKSPNMSFEEAAAIPQAGVLALQGLRYRGRIHPGDKVLINGAGGGVGTFAIQMAKLWGAETTVVDAREKLEMLKVLGADHLIDYKTENFTKSRKQYDLILDMVANRSIFTYKQALSSKGIYAMIGGEVSSILQVAFLGPLLSKSKGRKIGIVVHKPNRRDLDVLTKLYESGKIKPVIDQCVSLEKLTEAMEYFGAGRVQGKIVITMK